MHISSFTIENFKRFGHLKINNLGQFNLIVGDNNVGKTTLLESLLINENANNSYTGLQGTLYFRSINVEPNEVEKTFSLLLKRGTGNKQVSFQYAPKTNANKIHIKLGPAHLEDLPSAELKKLEKEILINKGQNELIEFVINNEKTFLFPSSNMTYFPIVLVNIGYKNDLVTYYTSVIQRALSIKRAFVANLNLFESTITDIEISTEFDKSGFLIVRTQGLDEAIPITMFGEGVVKLTRILLEIMMSKGNRLMIDEIDTGIHHSRFKKFWKTILKSAQLNNVQIFATTHSKECLQYFKEILEEDELKEFQLESRCIRLVQNEDKEVKGITYDFEQFQFALNHENEIR